LAPQGRPLRPRQLRACSTVPGQAGRLTIVILASILLHRPVGCTAPFSLFKVASFFICFFHVPAHHRGKPPVTSITTRPTSGAVSVMTARLANRIEAGLAGNRGGSEALSSLVVSSSFLPSQPGSVYCLGFVCHRCMCTDTWCFNGSSIRITRWKSAGTGFM